MFLLSTLLLHVIYFSYTSTAFKLYSFSFVNCVSNIFFIYMFYTYFSCTFYLFLYICNTFYTFHILLLYDSHLLLYIYFILYIFTYTLYIFHIGQNFYARLLFVKQMINISFHNFTYILLKHMKIFCYKLFQRYQCYLNYAINIFLYTALTF